MSRFKKLLVVAFLMSLLGTGASTLPAVAGGTVASAASVTEVKGTPMLGVAAACSGKWYPGVMYRDQFAQGPAQSVEMPDCGYCDGQGYTVNLVNIGYWWSNISSLETYSSNKYKGCTNVSLTNKTTGAVWTCNQACIERFPLINISNAGPGWNDNVRLIRYHA